MNDSKVYIVGCMTCIDNLDLIADLYSNIRYSKICTEVMLISESGRHSALLRTQHLQLERLLILHASSTICPH